MLFSFLTLLYPTDFDGDEMNMHVPQDLQSRTELEQLMSVTKNFCSAQSNKPVIGIIQDTLVGAYLFTNRDIFLTRDEMMNLMMHVVHWDGVIPAPAIMTPKVCLWTGKQMMSLLLPNNLVYTHKSKHDADPLCSASDKTVLIRQGELIQGRLNKTQLGKTYNGIIHRIWKDHGDQSVADFINGIQRMIDYWLTQHSFSTGIADCVPAADADTSIVPDAIAQVDDLIAKHRHDIEHPLVERKINQILNSARDRAGEDQINKLPSDHGMKTMAEAGSKGSLINICTLIHTPPMSLTA